MSEHFKNIITARNAILEELKRRADAGDKAVRPSDHGWSGRGQMQCPVCKIGVLGYSKSSYNGHVHARCNSDSCVRWME